MTDGKTLEVSLRLDSLDDLFVRPETLPWSRHYSGHAEQPALEYIVGQLVAEPSYRHVNAVFEVPADQVGQHFNDDVRAAVQRWAAARIEEHSRVIAATAARGIRVLASGILLFVLALGLSKIAGDQSGELADTLSRGLEVFAWVTLWFPLETLVFGMWQPRLDRRAAGAIGRMSFDLVPHSSPSPSRLQAPQ